MAESNAPKSSDGACAPASAPASPLDAGVESLVEHPAALARSSASQPSRHGAPFKDSRKPSCMPRTLVLANHRAQGRQRGARSGVVEAVSQLKPATACGTYGSSSSLASSSVSFKES